MSKKRIYARCHDCNCITKTKQKDIDKYFGDTCIFCCDKCIEKRKRDFDKFYKQSEEISRMLSGLIKTL